MNYATLLFCKYERRYRGQIIVFLTFYMAYESLEDRGFQERTAAGVGVLILRSLLSQAHLRVLVDHFSILAPKLLVLIFLGGMEAAW